MLVFFDTSALVKRYISEVGTDKVLDWCGRATEIGLSSIVLPEIISTFCRLRRESLITDIQYQQLKAMLFADIEDMVLCDLAPEVMAHSIASLENNVLRGMDAIHIGCAVILKAEVFVTADKRQGDAATRSGLRVDLIE